MFQLIWLWLAERVAGCLCCLIPFKLLVYFFIVIIIRCASLSCERLDHEHTLLPTVQQLTQIPEEK